MADDTTTFKLDLDASDFQKAVQDSLSSVTALGDADNLKGLITGFDSMLPMIGEVTTAVLAIKAAMGTVFEAEDIKAINEQFEILSANAGVSAEAIRSGMEKASGGLLTTTEQLQLSNNAIIKLGGSANKIPEIMELARKASVVTGQDLETTFNMMVQAIETGNKKMLARVGLNMDVTAAEKAYADQLGISVEALSQAGKTQAVLNAALELGNTRFAGINPNIKEATNTWQQFTTTLKELKETAALVFDKVFGPTVLSGLKSLADTAKSVGNDLKAAFGEPREKAEALQSQIGLLQKDVTRLQSGDLHWYEKLVPSYATEQVKALNYQIGGLQSKLDALKKTEATPAASTPSGTAPKAIAAPESQIDYKKQEQLEAKFQADMVKLKEEGAKAGAKVASDVVSLASEYDKQEELLAEQTMAKINQIRENGALTTKQKDAEIAQVEKNYTIQLATQEQQKDEKILAMKLKASEDAIKVATTEEQVLNQIEIQKQIKREQAQMQEKQVQESLVLDDQQKANKIRQIETQLSQQLIQLQQGVTQATIKAYQNQGQQANTFFTKFEAGAKKASTQAKAEFLDFSKEGSDSVNKLANATSQAFAQMGQGTSDLASAMGKAILGELANEAQAKGALLIASSIWPPNPLGLAAGAGLSALAGVLRGLSGGGSSAISTPTAAAGGGTIGATETTASIASTGQATPTTPVQTPQQQVVVNISGNLYNSQQTQAELANIIRSSADAADFKIQSIGNTYP